MRCFGRGRKNSGAGARLLNSQGTKEQSFAGLVTWLLGGSNHESAVVLGLVACWFADLIKKYWTRKKPIFSRAAAWKFRPDIFAVVTIFSSRIPPRSGI
jgi:hypothetical protein